MKVAIVSPTAKLGGAERALVALAAKLPAKGIDCMSILLEDGPVRDRLEEIGCDVVVVPAPRVRAAHRARRVVAELGALIARSGVDVVLSSHPRGHIFGGLAARRCGRPGVLWQHGIARRSSLDLLAGVVPSYGIVCGSSAAAQAQRRVTPRRQVRIIHPGTDLDVVAAASGSGKVVRRELGWSANPIVGIVGRLQPWKGQEVFLRAARRIADRRPDARFVIVGGAILGTEGDYPLRLERLAASLGLADVVHMAGHRDDVYAWIDAVDVLAHAATDEPFGLVLVEAMALGTPVVATAGAGPSEIVEDGISGLLVPGGDDQRLAAAVVRVLDAPDLASELRVAGRSRAQQFSVRRTAGEMAALLFEAVA